MDTRTEFDNLRLGEHKSPQDRRYAVISFDFMDIQDREREIRQDIASLEDMVSKDVFKDQDTIARLSSTIESIAHSLHVLSIEYKHIGKLMSRSERSGPNE